MSNKLSFILYEEHNSPRYFEIRKSFLKFLIFGLPFITFVSFLAITTVGVYFKQIRASFEKKEPKIINELRQKNLDLAKEKKKLEDFNSKLVTKLGVNTSTSPLSALGLFKVPQGQEDFTKAPSISIDAIRLSTTDEKVLFRFNLINERQEKGRVAGYLFVMMKVGEALYFYPLNSMPDSEILVNFNRGEVFSMKTLRPTEASFPLPKKSSKAIFKILIFSRTGDLLHKKIFSQQVEV